MTKEKEGKKKEKQLSLKDVEVLAGKVPVWKRSTDRDSGDNGDFAPPDRSWRSVEYLGILEAGIKVRLRSYSQYGTAYYTTVNSSDTTLASSLVITLVSYPRKGKFEDRDSVRVKALYEIVAEKYRGQERLAEEQKADKERQEREEAKASGLEKAMRLVGKAEEK